MRLSEQQQKTIRQAVAEIAGEQAKVMLFGSRVDDARKGGDIDLMIILPWPEQHPAQLSAKIGARLVRAFGGRKVDVLLSAPNLKRLPIH